MRKGVNGMIVAGISCLLLAGCGGAKDGAKVDGDDKVAAASDLDASDACALLDKAAVGAALADSVTETSLAFVNKAEGANAATSECTYRLAGGSTATTDSTTADAFGTVDARPGGVPRRPLIACMRAMRLQEYCAPNAIR